jgi:hypothetical protein
MIRYTRYSLKKLEKLFAELDYTIRYERGNFQSGYCIVEQRNIAVINKFYDTEGRINVLLEILAGLSVDPEQLEEASAKFYRQIESDLPDTSEEE